MGRQVMKYRMWITWLTLNGKAKYGDSANLTQTTVKKTFMT